MNDSRYVVNKLIKLTINNKIKWDFEITKDEKISTKIKISKNKHLLFNLIKLSKTIYIDTYMVNKTNISYISTSFLDYNGNLFNLFIYAKYINFMLNNKNFYNNLNDLDLDWIVLNNIGVIKLELESLKTNNKTYNAFLYIPSYSRPYFKINNKIVYTDLNADKKQYINLYKNIRRNQ